MLRLLVDKDGDGCQDLFLKIDATPRHVCVGDSYFLYYFFEIGEEDLLHLREDEHIKYATTKLLNYWIERLKKLDKGESTILIVEPSDQCTSVLSIVKNKRGFKVQISSTVNIQGDLIRRSHFEKALEKNEVSFQPLVDKEWLIGEEALFNGLNWSLNELKL